VGKSTGIPWCHHTFNAWRGCTKISPGCAHCYAEVLSKRNPAVLGIWGDDGTRVVASESMWRQPLRWYCEAFAAGERRRVFAQSLSDTFEDRPELDSPRKRLMTLAEQCRSLDWMFLTKRPEVMLDYDEFFAFNGHCWAGVSVEDRKHGLPRIDVLRKVPASVRFLSVEPLLEDLGTIDLTGIHWVIVGGESGAKARPFNLRWARSIRDQCRAANVPFFMKQTGAKVVSPSDVLHGVDYSWRSHDSHGGDPSEWPEDLRVREVPA
jgi:protein gp37